MSRETVRDADDGRHLQHDSCVVEAFRWPTSKPVMHCLFRAHSDSKAQVPIYSHAHAPAVVMHKHILSPEAHAARLLMGAPSETSIAPVTALPTAAAAVAAVSAAATAATVALLGSLT